MRPNEGFRRSSTTGSHPSSTKLITTLLTSTEDDNEYSSWWSPDTRSVVRPDGADHGCCRTLKKKMGVSGLIGSTTMYSVLPVWVDTPFPSSPWFCRIPCNCEPSFLLLARYWWLCRTSNIMTVAGGETAVLSSSLACGKVRKSISLDYGLFPVEILGRESFFAWLQNSGFNGEQVNSLMCHWRVFVGE